MHVNLLLVEKGYKLEITPEARAFLSDDPEFGARPLKRAIQHELQDPLALQILSGSYQPGSTILVSKGENGLEFSSH